MVSGGVAGSGEEFYREFGGVVGGFFRDAEGGEQGGDAVGQVKAGAGVPEPDAGEPGLAAVGGVDGSRCVGQAHFGVSFLRPVGPLGSVVCLRLV